MTQLIYLSAVVAGLIVALASLVKGIRWYLDWEKTRWDSEKSFENPQLEELSKRARTLLGYQRPRSVSSAFSGGPPARLRDRRPTWDEERSGAVGAGPHLSRLDRGSFARVRILLDDGAGRAQSVERHLCLN